MFDFIYRWDFRVSLERATGRSRGNGDHKAKLCILISEVDMFFIYFFFRLLFFFFLRWIVIFRQVTPWEAFVAESKFAMNIWADTKPVKVTKSSCRSSTSALAGNAGIGRAASVARSMVGSFLRLDILDTFDKENTSNTKSGNHKSN